MLVAVAGVACGGSSTPRVPTAFDADAVAPLIAGASSDPRLRLSGIDPRLPTTFGGAVTSFDARRGGPRFVWTREPAPESLDVTAAMRKRGATTAAGVAALGHVVRNAGRWGLDGAALATVSVAHVIDTGHGAIVARLVQRVDGIEVARTRLAVVMDRDLELVALSGGLHPRAEAGLPRTIPLAARDSLELAFDDAGIVGHTWTPAPDRAGYQRFTAPGVTGHARAKRSLFPIGTQLVPAWSTEVAGARHAFAADGRMLFRGSLTNDAVFSYRVWAEPTGDRRFLDGPQADHTPHPTGAPDGFDPPFIAPSLVTIDGFNVNPQNTFDPWLPAGATTTQGNNVHAYADVDFDDGPTDDDIRPVPTLPGVFDYTYDTAAEPDGTVTQQMAAVTHLFYVNNWLHDYFYDSGFTEATGNAQLSNFGRGGAEGDPLLVEAQDFGFTDNAFMLTPGDGASPKMELGIFTAPVGGPPRDSSLASHIVAHEWGHYIHHRLVDISSIQSGSMGEGWGDFIALLSTLRETDDLDGTFGMGAYPLRSYTDDAAYFGLRRYPYSTDFTKSPLTFRFVQSGVVLPAGIPTSDIGFLQGSDNWEVHNSGEIWCAMLWEGLVALVKDSKPPVSRFTFDEARRRFADYVVGGMAAAPVEPTYLEQRDAILAVARAADEADFVLLANAFARRGFGNGAVAPDLNSLDGSGVVESFIVTGALDITALRIVDDAASCDGDGFLDAGETGQVQVTVRNAGAAGLANVSISVASATAGVSFPSGVTTVLGPLAVGESATVSIAIELAELPVPVGDATVTVTATDASAAITSVQRATTATTNIDVTPDASAADTFEHEPFVWTASAAGFVREADPNLQTTLVRVRVAPSGDHTLQTPALQVLAGANLVLAFKHRHEFGDTFTFTADDGGVIEISTNGVDWVDVDVFANPGYDNTITGTGNVLANRAGYTARNPEFPAFTERSIDLGTGFGGATVFLRFRAGGDGVGDPSVWEIDDVIIGGIANTPFPAPQPETGSCLPGARPIADAGENFSVPSGGDGMLDGSGSNDPDGGALTFAWTQLTGPTLVLSSPTTAQPTFTAPVTQQDRFARFQLIVRDSDNRPSVPSAVTVRILAEVIVDGAPDGSPDAAVSSPDAPMIDQPDAGETPEATSFVSHGGGCAASGESEAWLLGVLVLGLSRRGTRRSIPSRPARCSSWRTAR